MRPLVEPVPVLSVGRRRRGARTAALAGVGEDGLRRLAATRVLVVGAGGLGSPVIALLAGSGLARLTVVDPDVVDASNLARQTLFTLDDVGRAKAEVAAARVVAVDPEVDAVAVRAPFTPELVAGHDVVVDAADSVLVTRAVSDACADAGVPFVWGTALAVDGQASVFWDAPPAAVGVDFHDLHPEPFADDGSCALDGVVPALCTVVGGVMAAQVVVLATGVGEALLGRVLTVDAGRWRFIESPLRRGPASRRPPRLPARLEAARLEAAGTGAAGPETIVARIAPAALAERLRDGGGAGFVLVDVRTPAERDAGVIAGSVVPDDVPADANVVVYCARGPRADRWAAANAAGRHVAVLDGGMEAWRREAFPVSMP